MCPYRKDYWPRLRPYQQQRLELARLPGRFQLRRVPGRRYGAWQNVADHRVHPFATGKAYAQYKPGGRSGLFIHNWQEEAAKICALAACTNPLRHLARARRKRRSTTMRSLSPHTTLLADVVHLKEYSFNYIFLDESQNIKNPDSQRYKAARLLRARNRIVLSGTPIENNTFDLYGQLSFTCPGLLGTRSTFAITMLFP